MTERPQNPARRRGLTVLAGLACLPLAGAAASRGRGGTLRWRGTALGAQAEMRFAGIGRREAADAAARVENEVARLERIFSLWRGDSELSRLNAAGRLAAPSQDLRLVLHAAQALGAASDGAFDVTVQPLWRLYAEAAGAGRTPTPEEIASALALVDHRQLVVGTDAVVLRRPGMAVTLNGIAQGHITDRVAGLLRRRGFRHVLVQLGETYALGAPPGREGWTVGLPDPAGGESGRLLLADRAVATSAGAALAFPGLDGLNHLLDPRSGGSPQRVRQVTVEAPRALDADGLSTALSFLDARGMPDVLSRHPGARARLVFRDGRRAVIEPGDRG